MRGSEIRSNAVVLGSSGLSNFQVGDKIGVILNLNSNKIQFSKNGLSGPSLSIDGNQNYRFAFSVFKNTSQLTINFGETPFEYAPVDYVGFPQTSPYVEVQEDGIEFNGASTFANDLTVSGALNVAGVSTFNDTVNFRDDGFLVGTISSTTAKLGGVVLDWPELVNDSGVVDVILTNNNLTLTSDGSGWKIVNSTQTATSGKYYVEFH